MWRLISGLDVTDCGHCKVFPIMLKIPWDDFIDSFCQNMISCIHLFTQDNFSNITYLRIEEDLYHSFLLLLSKRPILK